MSVRLPTMAQLDRFGVDAGSVLDSQERDLERAIVQAVSDRDRDGIRRALRRLSKRRDEFFGPEPNRS